MQQPSGASSQITLIMREYFGRHFSIRKFSTYFIVSILVYRPLH